MSSNAKSVHERCVHCLRLTETPQADHVFPDSWYPDSTPATVQRWTVPSCPECNSKLGQLEKDLLIRLGLCIDPKSEAASGLASRVFRSLGLDVDGLPEKEQSIRDKLRAKLRSEFIPYSEIAGQPGKIPGLGPPDESAEWVFVVPWAALSIIAEKIARGCEYRLARRLVEPPYAVRTFVTESGVVPEPFASHVKLVDFGPGCKIRRVFVSEDPNVVLYWISIWGGLCFRVHIDLEVELLKKEPMLRACEGIVPQENRGMQIPTYLRNVNQQRPDGA